MILFLLVRANYIEKLCTGIERIKNVIKALGKGTVEFHYDDNWFDVIFSCQAERMTGKILNLIADNPAMSAPAIVLKVSLRTVEQEISELKKNGIIKRFGPKKDGTWVIIK